MSVPPAEVERVCQVVRRWVKRAYATASNLEDLQQEGCLGVLEAVASYDPNHGAKFITYGFMGAKLRVWNLMEKEAVWHTASTTTMVREHRKAGKALPGKRSLDAPVGDEGLSLHERVAGEVSEPECELWDDDALRLYRGALLALSEQLSTGKMRAAALEMHKSPEALVRDIGARVGLSHERVHRIKNRAIQMTRDRAGIPRWMPRHRMVAVPDKVA